MQLSILIEAHEKYGIYTWVMMVWWYVVGYVWIRSVADMSGRNCRLSYWYMEQLYALFTLSQSTNKRQIIYVYIFEFVFAWRIDFHGMWEGTYFPMIIMLTLWLRRRFEVSQYPFKFGHGEATHTHSRQCFSKIAATMKPK